MKKWLVLFCAVIIAASCSTTLPEADPPVIEIVEIPASDVIEEVQPEAAVSEEHREEETALLLEEDAEIIHAEEETEEPASEDVPAAIEECTEEEEIKAEPAEPLYEPEPPEIEIDEPDEHVQEDTAEPVQEESAETVQELPEIISAEEPVSSSEYHEEPSLIEVPEEIPEPEKRISDDLILKEVLSYAALQVMGTLIIIIVLLTASVAIRSANRMPLSIGFSAVITMLFSLLPIAVSIAVAGFSPYWLLYLAMLPSYFIFRAKDRSSRFQ